MFAVCLYGTFSVITTQRALITFPFVRFLVCSAHYKFNKSSQHFVSRLWASYHCGCFTRCIQVALAPFHAQLNHICPVCSWTHRHAEVRFHRLGHGHLISLNISHRNRPHCWHNNGRHDVLLRLFSHSSLSTIISILCILCTAPQNPYTSLLPTVQSVENICVLRQKDLYDTSWREMKAWNSA
jgi:hypothetical protein